MLPETSVSDSEALRQLAAFAEQAEDVHAQWQTLLEPMDLGLGGFVVGVAPLDTTKKKSCTGYMWCDAFGCRSAQACTCTPCDCSTTCVPKGRGTSEDELLERLKEFEDQLTNILPQWDDMIAERGLQLHVRGYMVTARDLSWNAADHGWRVDTDDAGPCFKAPELHGWVVEEKRHGCC